MNNKIFLFKTLACLTLFLKSTALLASDIHSELSESVVLSSKHTAVLPSSTQFQMLPEEVMREIVIYAPSVLPALMRTDKDTYNKVSSFKKAITNFLGLEQFSYGKLITCTHPYKSKTSEGREYNDDKKAFEKGFIYLVLGRDKVAPPSNILKISYKIIRDRIKEHAGMPQVITNDYSRELVIDVPNRKINFSYLTLLALHNQQYAINKDFLEQVYSNYKSIKKDYEEDNLKDITKFRNSYLEHISQMSIFYTLNLLKQAKVPQPTLEKSAYKILKIYKFIALEKGYEEILYKYADDYREDLQRIPINLSTFTQEIPNLFNSCEEDIIRVAKERQRIVSQIQNMLRVG